MDLTAFSAFDEPSVLLLVRHLLLLAWHLLLVASCFYLYYDSLIL